MTPIARLPFQASRASCVLTLSLVFLTGAVAGAVVMSFHRHSPAAFYVPAVKAITLQKLTKDLNLNADQVRELETILDDFGLYYRNILSDGKSRIIRLLNDEQKVKFQKIIDQAL